MLSTLGLGAAATEAGLTVLTALLLTLNVASLAWAAQANRHWGPLALAALGAVVMVGWRIVGGHAPSDQVVAARPGIVYLAAAGLIVASGWNWWLGREQRRPAALVPLGRAGRPTTGTR